MGKSETNVSFKSQLIYTFVQVPPFHRRKFTILKQKNILFISSWFPNKLESTNGNFVQRHAEAVSLLHHVEVLHCIGVLAQEQEYIFDNQNIRGIQTLIIYYRKSKNPLLNFQKRMKAYKMGFEKMTFPDLVHGNILQNSMLFACYLKKTFGIPFVISEHWSGLLKINRKKVGISKIKIAKFIAGRANYLLPVSRMLAKEMKAAEIGKKFEVVENVVDTKLFLPTNRPSTTAFTFLHISNLISLKNPEKIIHAALKLRQQHTDFQLLLGGDGDFQPLQELVNEHHANDYIKIFGEQTLEEVAKKMRNSHAFVLFSDYENLPCVLLEAMSSGIPVITTRVGGIPEIVPQGGGLLIQKKEEDLLLAMKSCLENPQQFLKPEQLHHYINARFSPQKIAEKFDAVYQKVLHQQNKLN